MPIYHTLGRVPQKRHTAMRNRDFFKDTAAPTVKFTLALKN